MMAYTVNDVYCHLDLVCCTGLYRRLLEQVHSTLIPLYPGASGPGTARSVRERMFTATYMYIISTWMTMIVERKACVLLLLLLFSRWPVANKRDDIMSSG